MLRGVIQISEGVAVWKRVWNSKNQSRERDSVEVQRGQSQLCSVRPLTLKPALPPPVEEATLKVRQWLGR